MIAALLCPGPSLAQLDPARLADYAEVVGVNRAACAFTVKTWAACDYPLIRDWHPAVIGARCLITRRQTWIDTRRHVAFPEVRLLEDIACPVSQWDLKTATAALGYLATLPVKHIDVFGADWSNERKDFDGVDLESNDRTPERWAQESATWGAMVEWLAGRGVTVTRH